MRNVLTVVAIVVAGLGFVNFFTQIIPVYVSHPLAILAMGYLVIGRLLPARICGRPIRRHRSPGRRSRPAGVPEPSVRCGSRT